MCSSSWHGTCLEVDVVAVEDLDAQHLGLGLLYQHPEILIGPFWVQRILLVSLQEHIKNWCSTSSRAH